MPNPIDPVKWSRLRPNERAQATRTPESQCPHASGSVVSPAGAHPDQLEGPSASAPGRPVIATPGMWRPARVDPSILERWIGRVAVLHVRHTDGEVIAGEVASVRRNPIGWYDVCLSKLAPRAAVHACLGQEQVIIDHHHLHLSPAEQRQGFELMAVSEPGVERDPVLLPSLAVGFADRTEVDALKRSKFKDTGILVSDLLRYFPTLGPLRTQVRAQAGSAADPFELASRVLFEQGVLPAVELQKAVHESALASKGAHFAGQTSAAREAYARMQAEGGSGVHETLAPGFKSGLATAGNFARVCQALADAPGGGPKGNAVARLFRRSDVFLRVLASSDERVEASIKTFLGVGSRTVFSADVFSEQGLHWDSTRFERVETPGGQRVQLKSEALQELEEKRGVYPNMKMSGTVRCPAAHRIEGDVAMERIFRIYAVLVADALDARRM